MRTISVEEYRGFMVDELGYKHCPTGDYSEIEEFVCKSVFDDNCIFGKGASFGNNCLFGFDCIFHDYSSFGERCVFATGCKFMVKCSFNRDCEFRDNCSFLHECSFGVNSEFGNECAFGDGCSFGANTKFGDCTRFRTFSGTGGFGDNCIFGNYCTINEYIMIGIQKYQLDITGSDNTIYAIYCEDNNIIIKHSTRTMSLKSFIKYTKILDKKSIEYSYNTEVIKSIKRLSNTMKKVSKY